VSLAVPDEGHYSEQEFEGDYNGRGWVDYDWFLSFYDVVWIEGSDKDKE
jgi:hypothetical protein